MIGCCFFLRARCGKVHTEFKMNDRIPRKIYARGCGTKAICDKMSEHMKLCEDAKAKGQDAKCEMNCCSGNLCNAGATPVVSSLLILSCALVALFR